MQPRVDDVAGQAPKRLGFVLIPGFSLVTLGCALEPFRLANERSDRPVFDLRTLGLHAREVAANHGLAVMADGTVAEDAATAPAPWDIVFLISGLGAVDYEDRLLAAWLRRLARSEVTLAPIGAATVLAARLGLLDGYQCVTHWRLYASFLEQFPKVKLGRGLFSVDRRRLTSAGGLTAMDLALRVVADVVEPKLAAEVAEIALVTRMRPASEAQRMSVHWRYGISDDRLARALQLMEANIERPLRIGSLAAAAGVSQRQLERLFRRHLGKRPAQHYVELRLQQAHGMLVDTPESVGAIAARCGFSDASQLNRQFKALFGATPGRVRRAA